MTKYELKKYRFICNEIEQIREQIASMRAALTAPKNQIITGMPRGGGSGDPIGDTLCRIERLEARYKNKISKLIAEREKIENAIDELECAERLLVRYKYIDGLAWDEVAEKLNYSLDNTFKIHRRILQKIQKKC